MPTPTSARLMASFDPAYTIFGRTLAVSGALWCGDWVGVAMEGSVTETMLGRRPHAFVNMQRTEPKQNTHAHAPGEEDDLAGGPAVVRLKLHVDDRVPAVLVGQLRREVVPRLGPLPLLLDHDLPVLFGRQWR